MKEYPRLLEDLKPYLPNPDIPPPDYPETHQAMTGALKRVMPALRSTAIERVDAPRARCRAFQLIRSE